MVPQKKSINDGIFYLSGKIFGSLIVLFGAIPLIVLLFGFMNSTDSSWIIIIFVLCSFSGIIVFFWIEKILFRKIRMLWIFILIPFGITLVGIILIDHDLKIDKIIIALYGILSYILLLTNRGTYSSKVLYCTNVLLQQIF